MISAADLAAVATQDPTALAAVSAETVVQVLFSTYIYQRTFTWPAALSDLTKTALIDAGYTVTSQDNTTLITW